MTNNEPKTELTIKIKTIKAVTRDSNPLTVFVLP
jgi:hypothetical protein